MTEKILVTEKVSEAGLSILRDKNYEVDVKLNLTHKELVKEIPHYEALIVRSTTKVDRKVIEAAEKLRIIGRAGVTVDNIDIDAATEKGIIVCNAPTSNIVSAAEHTMALMLSCARAIPQANESMHKGEWERNKFTGIELYEKTLAIIGLGRIGGLVAERAKAFGMKLIGYDPYCSRGRAEQLGVTLYDCIDDILPLADFITVHLPGTKTTMSLFGPDQFAQMKDGVVLINAARAGIFDMNSLANFIAAGKIGAVALDLFDEEPCTNSPLHEFKKAVLTPHLGASTYEAQRRAGIQTAEYVAAGLSGSIVPTALNVVTVSSDSMDAVGPYVPTCQMMGSMLAQMCGGIPQNLKITAAGTLWETDISPLVAATIKGLLSYNSLAAVTNVNAEEAAKRHGITVESTSSADAGAYASAVSIEADGIQVACTLSGDGQTGRLISLLGYRIDVALSGQSLVFEYPDAPGRVGIIGMILGEANINITTMQIALRPEDNSALVYMNIEGEVSSETLAKLGVNIPELRNAWLIML